MNKHFTADLDAIEQLDHIGIMHAYATMRLWNAAHQFIRAAMDVDVAPGAIDITVAVMAWFQPTQPQDAAQYPVALWMIGCQFWRINLAGKSAANEHAVDWRAGTDFGTDAMPTGWGAFTAF